MTHDWMFWKRLLIQRYQKWWWAHKQVLSTANINKIEWDWIAMWSHSWWRTIWDDSSLEGAIPAISLYRSLDPLMLSRTFSTPTLSRRGFPSKVYPGKWRYLKTSKTLHALISHVSKLEPSTKVWCPLGHLPCVCWYRKYKNIDTSNIIDA